MSDYALWWSPDSTKLAFLRFDETNVDEFSYPVYNPSPDPNKVVPYPEYVTMKYPKPGYNNPLVSVHVFDLEGYLAAQEPEEEWHALEKVEREDTAPVPTNHVVTLYWEGQRLAKDSIIQEVAWVHNATLIIKETNRASDDGSAILFDLSHRLDRMGIAVRSLGKNGELSDGGWIDAVRRDLGITKLNQCRLFRSPKISIAFRSRWSVPTLPILISCPMMKATTISRCSALLTRVFQNGLLLALGKSQVAC